MPTPENLRRLVEPVKTERPLIPFKPNGLKIEYYIHY